MIQEPEQIPVPGKLREIGPRKGGANVRPAAPRPDVRPGVQKPRPETNVAGGEV